MSNQVLSEITKNVPYEKIKLLLEMLRPKMIFIKSDESDVQNAKSLSTHYSDALHCVLAQKSNADVIVTSNIKDFKGLFKSELPENI
jgi:predicted nucleic acid-binding protein